MIHSLKLRNFKKHEALDVSFTDGVNLVTGPNYAGKSTILAGIMFALGGATQVNGTNLQRKGTNGGFEVQMEFALGTRVFRVNRKKTSATLEEIVNVPDQGIGVQLLASGVTPVNDEIEKLLGMSLKRFRQLRYAMQKQAHAMLQLGVTELHKLIDEITKADEITVALDRLKSITTAEEAVLAALPVVDVDAAQVAVQLAAQGLHDCQITCEGLSRYWVDATKALHASLDALNESERQFAEVVKLRTKVEGIFSEIKVLNREYEAKKDRKEAFEAANPGLDMFEDWKGQEAEISGLEEIERDYRKRERKAQAGAERLAAARERYEAACRKANLAAEFYDTVLLDAKNAEGLYSEADHERATGRRVELMRTVADLEGALESAPCPACGRAFEDHDPAKVAEELETARNSLALAVATCEDMAVASRNAKTARTAADRAEAALTAAQSQRDDLEVTVREAEADLTVVEPVTEWPDTDAMRQKLRDRKHTADTFARLALDAVQALEHLQEAQSRLREWQGKLEGTAHWDQEISFQRQERLALQAKVSEYDAQLREAKVQLGNAESAHQRAERALGDAQSAASARQSREARLTLAQTLAKFLKAGRDRYTGRVWAQFMAQASQFAATCTDGRIAAIRRTEDGKFTFMEGDHEMQMADASGAQAAIMGLSVQIALAESAGSPLDVILVDEPCADMDPEHSLATTVLLASLGKQVIAVSHAQMDSSVCTNAIRLEQAA